MTGITAITSRVLYAIHVRYVRIIFVEYLELANTVNSETLYSGIGTFEGRNCNKEKNDRIWQSKKKI